MNEIIAIIEHKAGKKFMTVDYQEKRKCDVSKNILNVKDSERELDWKAETDLVQGIETMIDYYTR